ncbi:hypothetical protein U9M48_034985 [Paspalum notatum var. saurae]|uniref:HTH OST-type domain-containing protein n=1 Tax=Paspalum notatum var. saurae TaxID=547442 RepID=A0AAQ3X7W3_PASNO
MSQMLLRRVSAYSRGVRVHQVCCRRLSSSAGERRRGAAAAAAQDEEGRAVRVSVWWDFENCHIPNGVNVYRVAPRLAAALRAAGIRGPLSITAFGDVLQLARSSQEALAATGVAISHIPTSGKNSSDRSFMADLVYWIAQNPPPVHFFLISGDKDFANILHRLRMSNYNVLLACPSSATNVLCSAATIMWPWDALVRGENFSPKHFNHPPDGLHGSWYGQYKGALDDPFLVKESEEPIKVPSDSQHFSVPSDVKLCSIPPIKVSSDSQHRPVPSDTKNHSIPKYVRDAILKELRSYPKGISLSILRSKLSKDCVSLGTDFFGHKKFSSLLQSMPDIVKFMDAPYCEDEPYVIAVNKGLLQTGDGSSNILRSDLCNVRENNLTRTTHDDNKHPSLMSISDPEVNSKPQSSSQGIDSSRSFTETADEKPSTLSVSSSPLDVLSEDQKEYPVPNVNSQSVSPAKHMEVDERIAPGTSSSSGVENAVNKVGLFQRFQILLYGSNNSMSEVSQNCASTSAQVFDDPQAPLQESVVDCRQKLLRRAHKASSKSEPSDCTDGTASVNYKLPISSDNDHSEKIKRDPSIHENPGPFNKPASVFMGEAEKKNDTSETTRGFFSWASRWWTFGKSNADNSKANIHVTDEPRTDSIEEFEPSNTSTHGSGLPVANEIFTKPHMWYVLEQQLSKPIGSELILKAKTREELALGLQKLGCWPLKHLLEKDMHHLVHLLISEKKWIEETSSRPFPFRLILPHKRTCVPSNSSKSNGLSSIFSSGKPQKGKYIDNSMKRKPLTREEILSNCHKLCKELLAQYEYGFRIKMFKPRFTRKYGYELDHQKLGYPNIDSLLQNMPGARVKSSRVVLAEHENGKDGSKGNGNESNGDDLVWEELGPVSATTETAAAGIDNETCYRPPTPSDDDFSDNDSQVDQQPRRNAEQSSLLQIIDSWNCRKDDGSSKQPEDIGLMDCSRSYPSYVDSTTGKAERHTRVSRKQFSFVPESDSEEGKEKDKLVESVLGSLQKARGSKLHN